MAKMICRNCETISEPKIIPVGNVAIEIILWLFLLIPGIIYSIFVRSRPDKLLCPSCNQDAMIDPYSPVGQQILKKLYP